MAVEYGNARGFFRNIKGSMDLEERITPGNVQSMIIDTIDDLLFHFEGIGAIGQMDPAEGTDFPFFSGNGFKTFKFSDPQG